MSDDDLIQLLLRLAEGERRMGAEQVNPVVWRGLHEGRARAMERAAERLVAMRKALAAQRDRGRDEGLDMAIAACDPTGYTGQHASVRRRCQKAIAALKAQA